MKLYELLHLHYTYLQFSPECVQNVVIDLTVKLVIFSDTESGGGNYSAPHGYHRDSCQNEWASVDSLRNTQVSGNKALKHEQPSSNASSHCYIRQLHGPRYKDRRH